MIFISRQFCLAMSLIVLLPVGRSLADSPGASEPSTPIAEYGLGVRTTPWQTPEDERSGFHLPPGFEVRLFSSEPDIAKPLNMAFDGGGRLWVTVSVEYPYPVVDGADARDRVMVLSDTDGDGAADEVVTFADRLNIPMGVLPYGDGCLCFSIPDILYLRDTDGDGTCDKREIILGPFDTTRDTHGMINSMRDGGDGWIYACHGFNNQSEVAGRDGHLVRMPSGNTFRFRPDGSRVEIVTHGQVNPFGMTSDDWGYRYSADCHSKPITQLIRDACYPSFGRPHDGLGFLPPMVDHLHGSTAISGILYFARESDVEPLRQQLISGNVMTSRLNRNRLTYQGATAKGEELPDFMTSDDPWFRPVDIQLGPDGNIYVADFYNCIIGHYEVPLDHPQRDRTSGRIWQIRYLSADVQPKQESRADYLLKGLRSTNPTQRLLAGQSKDIDADAVRSLVLDENEPPYARVAAMRALLRASGLDDKLLAQLCLDQSDRVRVESFRLACDRPLLTDAIHDAAIEALTSANAHVVQAAVEWLSVRGSEIDVEPLFVRLADCDEQDPVLRQSIRIAIRNRYRDSVSDSDIWRRAADAEFASIMLGLDRSESTHSLLEYLTDHPNAANRDEVLRHVIRHATPESLADCIQIARRITKNSEGQFQLLQAVADSLNARPGHVPLPLRNWASDLVDIQLRSFEESSEGDGVAVAWTAAGDGSWPQRERKLASGRTAKLVDSIGLGETYTGVLRSDPFSAPEKEIRFWLAGHNGFPNEDDHGKNRVQLIDVDRGDVIDEVRPPRNDVAIQVRWDTSKLNGRKVRIECIDGDSASAYAWLAIGEFQPAWIQGIGQNEPLILALQWIRRLGLDDKEQRLIAYLNRGKLSAFTRIEIAGAIASLRRQPEASVLLPFLYRSHANDELIERTIDAVMAADTDGLLDSTKLLAKGLSSSQQREFALAWVQGGADATLLLRMCQDGWVSPSALADVDVRQSLVPRLSPEQLKQFTSLTKSVDQDAAQKELLQRIFHTVTNRDADRENGHRVFTKNCAVCHQLRGEGTVVGPQLDGAVTRSVERLLEDIVTPDQNVDRAFRTNSFLLDDGRVIVGLVRSESEAEITLVDSTGKVISIDATTIEQRRDAGRSLMPSNVAELISAGDIGDLLEYIQTK